VFTLNLSFDIEETPRQRLIDENGPGRAGDSFTREEIFDLESNQACVPVRKARLCTGEHGHQWWDKGSSAWEHPY
jgi:hypothetical protein